jgi:hypothetical protein
MATHRTDARRLQLVRLHGRHPDARTNMPLYARGIQRATALPVFGIVSLVTLVHGALLAGLPPRPA